MSQAKLGRSVNLRIPRVEGGPEMAFEHLLTSVFLGCPPSSQDFGSKRLGGGGGGESYAIFADLMQR